MMTARTGAEQQQGSDRWTGFYKESAEYFRRLRDKALREWRKPPPALEEIPVPGTLLDVGSGAGLLCVLAARRGASAVGLDVSLEGARAGRGLAREHSVPGCHFVVGDAHALPFRDGVFDAATHHATLEHLVQPQASLHETRRVLKPGGSLILFTVNALYPPRWRAALWRDLLAAARAPAGAQVEPLRRRGFEGPDERAWRAGECLDTWRIPAPVLRRMARALLEEERYETFHLCREGKLWLEENLKVRLERPSIPGRVARRAYLLLNRIPFIRHLGPVILWIGRRPGARGAAADGE
ncbi:MAG: class I SAM-dependent methyltransferase [Acidobacteriota bacterium]